MQALGFVLRWQAMGVFQQDGESLENVLISPRAHDVHGRWL
jgi:hypothetical protein